MIKAELLKAIEDYPNDSQVAYQDEDELDQYHIIRGVELVADIKWVEDVMGGVESKPSIILKTGRWWK
jgi:hypothetical protein